MIGDGTSDGDMVYPPSPGAAPIPKSCYENRHQWQVIQKTTLQRTPGHDVVVDEIVKKLFCPNCGKYEITGE